MKDRKQSKWTAVDTLYWIGAGLVSLGLGMVALSLGAMALGGFCLFGAYAADGREGGE